MQWIIPGTTLTGRRADAGRVEERFQGLFLAGGLTLSQVASITGLENHTIQNWVKRGFLPPPQNKRYDMEQLCRIININLLKGILPLEQIGKLMEYLNGDLADESDDLVDDTMLFFLFVKLASRVQLLGPSEELESALKVMTRDFPETVPGTREKLKNVLRVMVNAWMASHFKTRAEGYLAQM